MSNGTEMSTDQVQVASSERSLRIRCIGSEQADQCRGLVKCTWGYISLNNCISVEIVQDTYELITHGLHPCRRSGGPETSGTVCPLRDSPSTLEKPDG